MKNSKNPNDLGSFPKNLYDKIYHFDHAGASLMSDAVVARIQQHLSLELQMGGYKAQEIVQDEIETVYISLAQAFGGAKEDYAVTSSAGESWNKLFYSIPIKRHQNIVTAHTEYCSNYVAMLHDQAVKGYEIRLVKRLPSGDIDLNDLEKLVDANTALIALTWVGSSSGQILPARKVGEIARQKNVLYLLDACQAFGHVDVDLEKVGCHMASGTSRKFLRGPRGIGFLYIDKKTRQTLRPSMMTNQAATWTAINHLSYRQDARLFESWEKSVMNLLGFGVALKEYLQAGGATLCAKTLAMGKYIRQELQKMPHVTVTCPPCSEGAIITFNIKEHQANDVKDVLARQNINVNVASVSHTRLDLEPRGIDTTIRVSPHYITTKKECDFLLDHIQNYAQLIS